MTNFHHFYESINFNPCMLQYGFVNYALELLVVNSFGEETWEKIKYVEIIQVHKRII